MRHRIWSAALAAAALIMVAAQPARADGYPVRDGTGASQTFCSKLVGGLQYPCHLIYGMFGSTPQAVATDGNNNLNVHVQLIDALGTQADAAWSGSGSGTQIAIDKYIAAKVEATRSILAGTLTVQFASPQAVTQSGTWNVTNISGTVSLPTGASTAANQTAPQANAGSDATKATAVQGITGGKPVGVTTGQTSTDGSGTITTGGVAQVLFSGATPTNGFKVAIPAASNDGSVCWVSDTTTTPSATTAGSYPVFAQGQWSTEVGEKPTGAVYLTCPTTGQVFSAKKW